VQSFCLHPAEIRCIYYDFSFFYFFLFVGTVEGERKGKLTVVDFLSHSESEGGSVPHLRRGRGNRILFSNGQSWSNSV
jgi:hypothetical protein